MLGQLGLLMTFQLMGEALVSAAGIPFPGSLCGMLLLLTFLHVRGGPSDELTKVGSKLIENLGPCSYPPAPLSSRMALSWRLTAWRYSHLW